MSCVNLLRCGLVPLVLLAQVATGGPVKIPVVLWAEMENMHDTDRLLRPASTPSLAASAAPTMLPPASLPDGID